MAEFQKPASLFVILRISKLILNRTSNFRPRRLCCAPQPLHARGRHSFDRLFRDGIQIIAVCGRTCRANAKCG
jgi:hypothetical protein